MHIESDHDRQLAKNYMRQCLTIDNQIAELKAEKKDILDVMNEKLEIKPVTANKVLKAMAKGNMPELRHKQEQFEDLYQAVIR